MLTDLKLWMVANSEAIHGIILLAKHNPFEHRPVRDARLLGHRSGIAFRQTDQALVIDLPATLPTRHASAFAISVA